MSEVLEQHIAVDALGVCARCECLVYRSEGVGCIEEPHDTAVWPSPEILLAIGLSKRLVEGVTREPRPVCLPKARQGLALHTIRLRAKPSHGFDEGGPVCVDRV